MADSANAALGASLGDAAAVPHDWLALGRQSVGPLVIMLAQDRAEFTRWSRGRLPSWSGGATFPGSHLIIIRKDAGDPFGTLRHELAHVVLHQQVGERVPLWFDEGYAVLAAGEYDRFASLRLNLAVSLGHLPADLRALDGELRGDATDAEAAYALAGSAVAELARRNPTGTLLPLFGLLKGGVSFDDAVTRTTGLDPDRFDGAWRQSVRRRYNVLTWAATGGAWLLVTFVLIWAAAARKRRDAPRRAALDTGWTVPPDDEAPVAIQDVPPPQLDHPDQSR
ncbi:MAG TPA: hypothetical protein VHW65_09915 [Gemmatimonadales bacterium]|jgi:hypothetical protein|nr:hypothetical protein [Gemmatimonadales bacterium]